MVIHKWKFIVFALDFFLPYFLSMELQVTQLTNFLSDNRDDIFVLNADEFLFAKNPNVL